jgi:hypothetical protein
MNTEIKSEEYWIKIVDFLQQNWALIEYNENNRKVSVFFVQDDSKVFDKIDFNDVREAEIALRRNGFKLYQDMNDDFKGHVPPPLKPYNIISRPIYSSGEYWK